jgi:hypothetical protein
MLTTRSLLAFALAGLLAFIWACGYALEGRGSFLPGHILRVGIPSFKNLTTTVGLEEVITAEIYSEFITRGDYQLSGDTTGVDAVLLGEITSYNYVARAVDEQGMATSYMILITANIVFRDLKEDKVLWEQRGYRFQSEYQMSAEEGEVVTQEAEAVQRAAEDFAKSIVSTILTGF